MTTMAIYQNENERQQHLGTIHEIARKCGRPEDEVERIYELELTRLMQVARLKAFVPVLAHRAVMVKLAVLTAVVNRGLKNRAG